jgi:hypothetical protein
MKSIHVEWRPWAMAALMVVPGVSLTAEQPDRGSSLPDLYADRATDLGELRKGFINPPRKAGPWVYWFWFDNVVNRQEITRELEELAAAGVGGVELRCVSMRGFADGSPGPWFDPQGWQRLDHRRYEYLSPEHVDVLEHTLTEAKRLGLHFSINLGMGWPPGGRWITDQHRTKHLVTDSRVLRGPIRLDEELDADNSWDVGVYAWRLTRELTVDPQSFTDLTSKISESGKLAHELPSGHWLIGTFRTVPGGLCDKGEGPEVDPASREAVLFHLDQMFSRMEPKLARFFGSTLVDVASDSWEYVRSRWGRYWSPQLIESAPDILGYDLRPRMHVLLGYGPNERETLHDIEQLQRKLIHTNYFETVAEFLAQRKLCHRPQIYGRGLERDLLTAYSIADIPEIEEGVYVPEAIWAGHLMGKPIISCEAFTHVSARHGNLRYDAHRGPFAIRTTPEKMWKTTPSLLRALSNAHFARGVNRIQMHSFSYSPPGIPAPGWRMYAEIHLNRNVPWWSEFPSLCKWTARNQLVLQAGVPVTDILVYPVQANPVDGPFNTTPDQPVSAINAIDAANAHVLSKLVQRKGASAYRCQHVIVRDDIQTLAEADNLLKLANCGMTIWCCQAMPEDWMALCRHPARDAHGSPASASNKPEIAVERLQTALQRAVAQGHIRDACQRTWQEVARSLQSVRWSGSGQLSFQHRRVDDAEVYLISSWEQPFQGTVSFPHQNRQPELWDPETGTISHIEDYAIKDRRMHFPWQQEKNESRIIVFPKNQ